MRLVSVLMSSLSLLLPGRSVADERRNAPMVLAEIVRYQLAQAPGTLCVAFERQSVTREVHERVRNERLRTGSTCKDGDTVLDLGPLRWRALDFVELDASFGRGMDSSGGVFVVVLRDGVWHVLIYRGTWIS